MFILSVFQECDLVNGVTCVNLNFLDQNGVEESVCLQCPDGTAGDGRECRGTQHSLVFPSIPHLHPSPLSLPLSFHPTISLPSIPPLILPSHPFPPLHPSPYPSIPPFPSPPSLPLSFHSTLSLPSIPPLILPSHPFPPLHPSPYPSIPPFPSPPSLPLSFHPDLPLPSIPATLPNLPLSLSLLLFLHFSLNAFLFPSVLTTFIPLSVTFSYVDLFVISFSLHYSCMSPSVTLIPVRSFITPSFRLPFR